MMCRRTRPGVIRGEGYRSVANHGHQLFSGKWLTAIAGTGVTRGEKWLTAVAGPGVTRGGQWT